MSYEIRAIPLPGMGEPHRLPTRAESVEGAVRAARRLARKIGGHYEYQGYGPQWEVYDADSNDPRPIADGRL